jgi:hypothetical protein
MHLARIVAGMRHGASGPCVPSDETRAKIDLWIAIAPDTRLVETVPTCNGWTTQALEDGEVRYEETELGVEEPELQLLASWCERQVKKVEARPPVRTSGAPLSYRARRVTH